MKVFICFLVISGMINVTIGLLFGRGRGGQEKQQEHIVKHLHQHEIKIIHEGSGYHDVGGGGGGGADPQIVLLEGIVGGGGVGHGGFGHNTGVFNGGGPFSNFGGGNGGNFGGIGDFAPRSGIIGSTAPAQIINLVGGGNHGNFPQGFTGSQIVGFVEEGHARGYGGGHTHGIGNGFTAPQIVEFVEEGHARGYGGGHAHGIGGHLSDAQIVQFVEEGHARGYGGGHAHGRDKKFSGSEIAGFVEDGFDHGYGGGHSQSYGDSGINGHLTSILGVVEDEHIHHNIGFSHGSVGGGGGEHIVQVLHGDDHHNSIHYDHSPQHILKIVQDNHGISEDHSFNGHGFGGHGGDEIKLIKVIAENNHGHEHAQEFSHCGGHEKIIKIIQ